MDANENSDPPPSSATDFTADSATWSLDSESAYFFAADTDQNTILTEFGWNNLHHNHSSDHRSRGFGDLDQIEIHELEDIAPGFAGASVAEVVDASTSNPSVCSSSSEDQPEKSSISTVKPPELQVKVARKKGQKRIKQPRFAFMTKSEVDHLEDGYRWRKYGQKAVKNSPFPRSYYKCTNSKCTVKKRVERSSKDPSFVITTYEGQHCHHAAGFPRSAAGVFSNQYSAGFAGQFSNYQLATQSHDHHHHHLVSAVVSSSSSGNDQARDQSLSQIAVDQGLLGDIVSPAIITRKS